VKDHGAAGDVPSIIEQTVVRISPEKGYRRPRQRASISFFGLFVFALRVVKILFIMEKHSYEKSTNYLPE
jgi:hypothetical protein